MLCSVRKAPEDISLGSVIRKIKSKITFSLIPKAVHYSSHLLFMPAKLPLFWYQTLFFFFFFSSFWEPLFSTGLRPPCPCSAPCMVPWPMPGHQGARAQGRKCVPAASLRVGSGLFLVWLSSGVVKLLGCCVIITGRETVWEWNQRRGRKNQ